MRKTAGKQLQELGVPMMRCQKSSDCKALVIFLIAAKLHATEEAKGKCSTTK